MQVDPIKPTLKAPRSMHSKPKYVKLPSSFAFNFKLRRYIKDRFVKEMKEGRKSNVPGTAGQVPGRGLHSSTTQLNLSCLRYSKFPLKT